MPVIAVTNMKGGVSKTSTCHHVAGTLALMGRSVLLLDNDPQSSLSQGFWGPSAALSIDPAETIASVYTGDAFPERIIRPSGVAGIDLVPGSIHSTRHNVPVPEEAAWDAQTSLRTFLEDVRDCYDVVLIDTPPNLHLCTWASMVASDYVLIPLSPEDYGSQGLVEVMGSVARVVAGPNPDLKMLGILLTMVASRRAIHALYEERIRAGYGDAVFTARVPEAADFPESIARRLPIAQYKPRSAAAKAIRAVAEELLSRFDLGGVIPGNQGAAEEAA